MVNYDSYLAVVLDHLRDRWLDPQTGIVAAGIFHPAHPPVIATSQWMGAGKWLHAERNALISYTQCYGDPGRDSVIVVTLSPCLRLVSQSREGSSCGQLLIEHELCRVHAGVLDEYQVANGAVDYAQMGIEMSFAEDERLSSTCTNLANLFADYGAEINAELPKIKRELKSKIFV